MGIKIDHMTLNNAQTISMIKRFHPKLKQILQMMSKLKHLNGIDVILAEQVHDITHHQSMKRTLTETFQGQKRHILLDRIIQDKVLELKQTSRHPRFWKPSKNVRTITTNKRLCNH